MDKINERNKLIDILKAIGILFVIMGHTGSGFTGYIYTFHMGLFFFISGFLSYGKETIKIQKLITKNMFSIIALCIFLDS